MLRATARHDAYDAIVVGGGLGGLSAAALLARAGRSVLLVERHDRPGGYAHAFRRGRLRFDSGVHLVGGCGAGGPEGAGLVHRLLQAVGTRDACDFLPVDPLYATTFPGFSLQAPAGIEEFVHAHARRFPAQEKGLRSFVQTCLDIRREAQDATDLHLARDLAMLRRRHQTLVRFHRATLDDVLRAHVDEPRLAAALSTLWPYVGLPPSRASFVYWATMLASYLVEGAWTCSGSFQRLADALVTAIERLGGEVLLRRGVRRLRVRDGRVRGVVLEGGQEIAAPIVVSNADARQTFGELVPPEALEPRFVARLARMRPSVSAFVVYAAGSYDAAAAGLAHENFVWPSFDHDAHAASAAAGRPDWLTITVPTLRDPDLAPAGTHTFVLTTLLPHAAASSWRASKGALTERLLARAEQALPGLHATLSFVEAGTPGTLERYTRNTSGAAYGWEHSPDQVGLGRLGLRSPIAGLFLAGHWTRPGGGVYGVVKSGVEVAASITGQPGARLLAPA